MRDKPIIQMTRKQLLLLLFVFLGYVLVTCATQFMQGDDYLWYFTFAYDELNSWFMPNGRYVSNALTYVMIRYSAVRWIIFPMLLLALLGLLGAMPSARSAGELRSFWLALGLFLLMPTDIYANVIYFMSAYVIYVLPVVCALIYLLLAFRYRENPNARQSVLRCCLVFVVGAVGALCLESMTVYACCLGLFMVIWSFFADRKRGLAMHLCYFIGTALGAVAMLTNEQYNIIAVDDQAGNRFFELDLSDVFVRMYRYVMPRFAKTNVWLVLLIGLALYYLYAKADRSGWSKSRSRYAALSSAMVAMFAVYSLFTNFVSPLIEISWAMRIYAFEMAIAFLYCVAVLYLVYLLLPPNMLFRIAIYLCSAVINSFIFCFVSPITSRCFFANYVFWLLAALEIIMYVCREKQFMPLRLVQVAVSALCGFMLYCAGMNKYADLLRASYLKEQLENPKTRVYEVLLFPYAVFDSGSYFQSPCLDDASKTTVEQLDLCDFDEGYFRVWAEYYGLDLNPGTFRTIEINLIDYNTDASISDPTIDAAE